MSTKVIKVKASKGRKAHVRKIKYIKHAAGGVVDPWDAVAKMEKKGWKSKGMDIQAPKKKGHSAFVFTKKKKR
jgi:hypothetical protein